MMNNLATNALESRYITQPFPAMTTTTQPLPTNANLWDSHPELCQDVAWKNCLHDEDVICEANVGNSLWHVRLNGVDHSSLYSLHIDNDHVCHFDDWPGFWRWPGI